MVQEGGTFRGAEGPSGGREGHLFEGDTDLLGKGACDFLDHRGDRRKVMDLAIHHGTIAVLPHLDGEDLDALRDAAPHKTRDLSRADIEGVEEVGHWRLPWDG
jgi:hypothetical protein